MYMDAFMRQKTASVDFNYNITEKIVQVKRYFFIIFSEKDNDEVREYPVCQGRFREFV